MKTLENAQSFKHPETEVDEDETWNVNDLIPALERFKAKHGGNARVSLFFQADDGEIHPYQVDDVNNVFFDYEQGDVCNIKLTQ